MPRELDSSINNCFLPQLLKKLEKQENSDIEKLKEKPKKPEREKLKDDRAPGGADAKKRQNGEHREDKPRKFVFKPSLIFSFLGLRRKKACCLMILKYFMKCVCTMYLFFCSSFIFLTLIHIPQNGHSISAFAELLADMRKMDAGSIGIVKWTESEITNGIGSDGRKRKSESRGRMRSGGRGGSAMMEKMPTKRERKRAKRKRSMYGKRERMGILASPQVTFKLTNMRNLRKILKRKKV